MEQLTSGPVQKVIFMDPWYSLRQIEVIAHNFPSFPWFDPMTEFPNGKDIDWGPVYPVLSAAFVVLLGAADRADVITIASWIPPLFSLIMVPIVFVTGSIIADRKAGIIAGCLTSVIAGEYLYRSFFGYLDHHFLEVIFSTLFILLYLFILREIQTIEGKCWKNRNILFYSIFAGLVYYLGIMNILTMVVFAGIIGVFCFAHSLISRNADTLKALISVHSIIFGISIVLVGITGVLDPGFSNAKYTIIQIPLSLALIAEPIFLTAVISTMAGRAKWQTSSIIIGIPAFAFLVTGVFFPAVTERIIIAGNYFFFLSYQATFINEMQMWDMARAYHSFNITLIFMIAGLIISIRYLLRKYDPVKFCAIIWAVIILIATIMHLRYEYYIAVIIVLYSAVALAELYQHLDRRFGSDVRSNNIKLKKGNINPGARKNGTKLIPTLIIGFIIILITALSTQTTLVVIDQMKMISINDDWVDSLKWLEQNSPDSGIDNLKIYNKDGFTYPERTYGILSWWDYGHWITYLAKRIPITSPFQGNVAPVAQFLISTDEKSADSLANETGARYIIIDYEMMNNKFPAIPLWALGEGTINRYQVYYYQPSADKPNQYDPILTLKPEFFTTMLSRLYIFDGSSTDSTEASQVTYSDMQIGGKVIPVVSKIVPLSPEQAESTLKGGQNAGTDLVSVQYTHPITNISATTHYRLIYESPSSVASDDRTQLHYVKIFERVPGYQISGEGTIAIQIQSNQDRKFTYRQDSVNGSFIVPYSTKRDGNGVKALGPYRNEQTGESFEVTEEQVEKGI